MTDHGYETREGVWTPPVVVPPSMSAEARAALGTMEQTVLTTAGLETVRKWLVALGNVTASAATEDEARVKVTAMLGLLDDYPAGCFTKSTLRHAASSFTFFPSFAELSKLLDGEAGRLRTRADRLRVIAAGAGARRDRGGDDARRAGPGGFSPVVDEIMKRFHAGESTPQADLDAAKSGTA